MKELGSRTDCINPKLIDSLAMSTQKKSQKGKNAPFVQFAWKIWWQATSFARFRACIVFTSTVLISGSSPSLLAPCVCSQYSKGLKSEQPKYVRQH
mmetsp:Transcript_30757/g.49331  ORF Transcript_30757/g.49331 Transcript_30757/m.49331 type:complete len:96 (-) Transcript_30757:492-779(-)